MEEPEIKYRVVCYDGKHDIKTPYNWETYEEAQARLERINRTYPNSVIIGDCLMLTYFHYQIESDEYDED